MNFDEALMAHIAWKLKLAAYLKSPDGSLKSVDVQVDNKCRLGLWIYSEGAQFSSLPEYAILKSEHAKFHKAAAAVIDKADAGQNVSEDVALGARSEFATTSQNVVNAIINMRKKAQQL